MGLDLSHYKATHDVTGHSYAVEDFPLAAFEEYGFGRFVQSIPAERCVYFATFYEDEVMFQERMASRASTTESVEHGYWLGTPEANGEALRRIERRLGLDRASASRRRALALRNGREYGEIWIGYYEPSVEPGIYAVDAGYQRKGMDEGFYERFAGKGCSIFIRDEDFMSLEGFLLPEMRDELLPNLRANFIENYERGTSFLYVSA